MRDSSINQKSCDMHLCASGVVVSLYLSLLRAGGGRFGQFVFDANMSCES